MSTETHAHSQTDRLVAMANQIARAFAVQGEARAVPQIEEHIRLFWNPAMRQAIAAHAAAGGDGLLPLALKAVRAG